MIQLARVCFGPSALLLLALAPSAACLDEAPELGETSAALAADDAGQRAQLAVRWAPVHYQDVDQTGSHALGGAADYLAAYDFDGNLNARDNWDHAGNAALPLRATGTTPSSRPARTGSWSICSSTRATGRTRSSTPSTRTTPRASCSRCIATARRTGSCKRP